MSPNSIGYYISRCVPKRVSASPCVSQPFRTDILPESQCKANGAEPFKLTICKRENWVRKKRRCAVLRDLLKVSKGNNFLAAYVLQICSLRTISFPIQYGAYHISHVSHKPSFVMLRTAFGGAINVEIFQFFTKPLPSLPLLPT